VAFELKGSDAVELTKKAFALFDRVQLFSRTGNLGDTRSIITHPASTTHGRISQQARDRAGIGAGLVRLAVGLEDLVDLQKDLEQGLR
jgi:O-succinylhomoserine sulfhydrylase